MTWVLEKAWKKFRVKVAYLIRWSIAEHEPYEWGILAKAIGVLLIALF